MRGSWAGAMGHTQWMPEVWLHVGMDYDGDGKISPFGKPDDALGATAKYLLDRGKYSPGEHRGCEVHADRAAKGSRSYAAWTSSREGGSAPTANRFRSRTPRRSSEVPSREARHSCSEPNFYSVRASTRR